MREQLEMIALTGVVEADSRVPVSFPRAAQGLGVARSRDAGARVQEGDFLIEFDGSRLAKRLNEIAATAEFEFHQNRFSGRDSVHLRKEMREILNAWDELTVRAPVAGFVSYLHGQAPKPGTLVSELGLEIHNPTEPRIRVAVEDATAVKIRVGQTAWISLPDTRDKTLQGKVVEIRSSSHKQERRVMDVWIGLAGEEKLALPAAGSSVDVHIEDRGTAATPYISQKPRGRQKLMWRAVAALVLVGIIGAAASFRNSISARLSEAFGITEEDPIPVLALERKSLELEIQSYGEVVGMESVPVPTPVTRLGNLKLSWLIPEGTMVKKGEPIVQFDTSNLKLSLEAQTATLAQNMENTKITTGNQQLSEKAMSIDRTQAQMDYDYSMTVMPNDETIFSKWAIIEAQVSANLAKSRIDNLAIKSQVSKRLNRSQQQVLSIDRTRTETEVEIINQSLEAMELQAPADGLLLYRRERRRDPQIGDSYQPRKVVAEIVNLNALQARIYVLEKEAGSLAKNKPVTLQMDALPGKEFHGIVSSVSSLATTLERNSPVKYFTCEVMINDAAPHLAKIRPGMALRARVILEKYESCYVVPAGAVTVKGNANIVYVKRDGRFVARPVELGLGKHGQMTILKGVDDKEVVALRNPEETRRLTLPDFSKGYLKRRKEP